MSVLTMKHLNRLIGDSPIENMNDDQLEFNAYAKVLAYSIIESYEPIAIGIFAGWGLGKTSLMNLIRQNVEEFSDAKGQEADIITVWFNSWKYESENYPIISLCAAIISQLKSVNKNDDRLNRLIAGIKKIVHGITIKSKIDLTNLVSFETNVSLDQLEKDCSAKIEALLEDSLYYNAFEALSNATRNCDRVKIIVFIDDLDRCSPTRAISLLENIKLIFNQPNFRFVFGLDRRTVSSYLNKKYDFDESMGNAYLEKIFQVSFIIPDYSGRIEKYASELIKSYFGIQVVNEFKPIFPLIANLCENNPRRVKRLLNNILIDYQIQQHDNKIPIHFFAYSRALQMNDKWQVVSNAIKHNSDGIREKLSEDVYRNGNQIAQVRKVLHEFSDDKITILGPIFRRINMDQSLLSILISKPAKEWLKSEHHEKCWVILDERYVEQTQDIKNEKPGVVLKRGKIVETDAIYKYFPIAEDNDISEQIRKITTNRLFEEIKGRCEITYWEKVNWTYFEGAVGDVVGTINAQGISIVLLSFKHNKERLYMFIASSGLKFLQDNEQFRNA